MKLLFAALAFVSAGALACPADDAVKDAQAAPDKAAVAKAPERSTAPAKSVAQKKAQTTKVADKSDGRKPSL
jgi:hypothetical protein